MESVYSIRRLWKGWKSWLEFWAHLDSNRINRISCLRREEEQGAA